MSTRSRATGLAVSGLVTMVVFLALAGPDVLLHPGGAAFGRNPSNDFQIMAWSLQYWPWAIAHGQAPWHTSLLWAPSGFSTFWLTSIPGPALAGLPLTLTAGPLVAYNVFVLLAAPLASICAYLLCWELTERMAPSVLGGLLFGLSPYLLGHALSEHLNLLLVFPLPLLALACVRRARGATTTRRFAVTVAVLVLVLAASSLELFVDTVVLTTVMAAACVMVGGASRFAVRQLAPGIAVACALCSPVLVLMAVVALSTQRVVLAHSPADFSTDLLNLVLPTPTSLAGAAGALARVTSAFVGNIGERDGFLGLPVLLVAGASARADRRLWPLALLLVAAVVFSLGPVAAFDGRPLVSLPVSLTALPVVGDALPARFAVFAALAASVLVSVWFARSERSWLRVAAAVGIGAFAVPNFWPSPTPHAWSISSEFAWSTSHIAAGIGAAPPAGNVLVLPTGDRTLAQWWQARAGMRFRLAVPETPFVPPPLGADATVVELVDDTLPQIDGRAFAAARLSAFLRERRVDVVVVAARERKLWFAVVRNATGSPGVRLAGNVMFAVRHARSVAARRMVSVRLRAEVVFDGRRGQLIVGGRVLSHEDVESAAASARRPAVAFEEWTGRRDLLAVATQDRGVWHTSILDSSTVPIWSERVTSTRDGSIVAGWIDASGYERRLRLAAQPRGGRWTRPATLDTAEGLGSFMFLDPKHSLSVGWSDTIASEFRVRVSRFASGRWSTPQTIATSLGAIDTASVLRRLEDRRSMR